MDNSIFENASPESLLGSLRTFVPATDETNKHEKAATITKPKVTKTTTPSALCSQAVTSDIVGSDLERSFHSQ